MRCDVQISNMLRNEEASGSIPLSSTRPLCPPFACQVAFRPPFEVYPGPVRNRAACLVAIRLATRASVRRTGTQFRRRGPSPHGVLHPKSIREPDRHAAGYLHLDRAGRGCDELAGRLRRHQHLQPVRAFDRALPRRHDRATVPAGPPGYSVHRRARYLAADRSDRRRLPAALPVVPVPRAHPPRAGAAPSPDPAPTKPPPATPNPARLGPP